MASFALANALKDFGAPASTGGAEDLFSAPTGFPAFDDLDIPQMPMMAEPEHHEPEPEPVNVDLLIAEAVSQAEAALTERLTREHADAIAAERDRHAAELNDFQEHFAQEASEKIATSIAAMETQVVDLTSAVAARILGVVLTDDMRERSLERLATIIKDALADNEAVRIRLRGSLPLFDALKEKLPPYADQFDFAESPNFDISVTVDDAVYETRLAEWSTILAEVLG
jgi:hypothetical protein